MTRATFYTLCFSVIVSALAGCSCSRDESSPASDASSSTREATDDSRPEEESVLDHSSADFESSSVSEEVEPGQNSTREAAADSQSGSGQPVGGNSREEQSDLGEDPLSDHGAPSSRANTPPEEETVTIEPPPDSGGGGQTQADVAGLASSARRSLSVAERHATRGDFGDACRELLSAYNKLAEQDLEGSTEIKRLLATIADRLERYGDAANSAAGAVGGRASRKPLMVQ